MTLPFICDRQPPNFKIAIFRENYTEAYVFVHDGDKQVPCILLVSFDN